MKGYRHHSRKRRQEQKYITRRKLRKFSGELKHLKKQHHILKKKSRKFSGELKRLKKQQRIMKRRSRRMSDDLKRLRQKFRKGHESKDRNKSQETEQKGLLEEVTEILREGMKHFVRGILR